MASTGTKRFIELLLTTSAVIFGRSDPNTALSDAAKKINDLVRNG